MQFKPELTSLDYLKISIMIFIIFFTIGCLEALFGIGRN